MTAPTEPQARGDAELITAVRGGDREAYGELWQRHVGAANRLARQIASSQAEADDLVSESFAKVLSTLQSGGGPDTAFRAYLLTALRNTFYDKVKRDKRVQLQDDMTAVDPGVPFRDTALEGLESSLAARAFASLPERWQTVLWHTEIEGESAATVAPILGLTPNGVSALAYRAREGLRQAYLQVHLADTAAESCRSTSERLGAWARKGLSKREMAQVDAHLKDCDRCKALAAELLDVNHGLRGIVAAIICGAPWVAGYLGLGSAAKGAAIIGGAAGAGAAAGGGGAAAGGAAGGAAGAGAAGGAAAGEGGKAGALAFIRMPTGGPAKATAAAGGAVVVAAAAIALALSLTGHHTHHKAASPPRHTTTAPAKQQPPPQQQNPPAQHAPAPHHPPSHPVTEPALPPVNPPVTHKPSPTKPPTKPSPTTQPTPPPTTQPPTTQPTTPPPTTPPPTTPPPTKAPPPAPGAALTPTLKPIGSLVAGRNGVLALTVNNAGPGSSGPLTAAINLPSGVTEDSASGDGWSNGGHSGAAPGAAVPAAATSGSTLHGPSVAKNGTTTVYISVTVAASAPAGGTPSVVVTGTAPGSKSGQTVHSPTGVMSSGLGAERVVTDHAGVFATGNTFLSCLVPRLCARPGVLNDETPMFPYDADHSRLTAASSSAQLQVPSGASIVWAGLYWSGDTPASGAPISALIGRSSSGYQTVHANRVDHDSINGDPTYQAFANVTALVRSGGTWSVGLPSKPVCGRAKYAGWSLIVIAHDPSLPVRQVGVFDGLHSVDRPVHFSLAESAAGAGRITTVAWEGDDGLTGDRVELDGAPLASSADMENSSAEGSIPAGWNTFGTDVHTYPVNVGRSGNHTIDAVTGQDLFSLGVVGAELPPQN